MLVVFVLIFFKEGKFFCYCLKKSIFLVIRERMERDVVIGIEYLLIKFIVV